MNEKIKAFLMTYTIVTTMVVIGTAIYISIFWNPHEILYVNILWEITCVSFLASLGNFIYPNWELTKKQMLIFLIIHYVYINLVVLVCGSFFQWFSIRSFSMVCGMLVLIAVIFTAVTIIMTKRDKRLADSLNEILEQYQENDK